MRHCLADQHFNWSFEHFLICSVLHHPNVTDEGFQLTSSHNKTAINGRHQGRSCPLCFSHYMQLRPHKVLKCLQVSHVGLDGRGDVGLAVGHHKYVPLYVHFGHESL